jgi:outer membrane protein OmpA-like peptidoglycan-associated protein
MRTRALHLLCLLAVLLPGASAAQLEERFDVQAFRPYGGPLDLARVAQSRPVAHGSLVGSVYLNHMMDPLVLVSKGGRDKSVGLVENRLQADILATVGLWEWAELALVVPVVAAQSGDNLEAIGTEGYVHSGVLGDIRLQGKLAVPGLRRPPGESGLGAALTLGLGLPTGSVWDFASEGAVTSEAGLVVDWRFDSGALLSLNTGVWLKPRRYFFNARLGNMVTFGLAGEVPTPVRHVTLLGMATLATPLEGLSLTAPNQQQPAEAMVGVRWYGPRSLTYTLGAGMGCNCSLTVPTLRVFASVAWVLPEMAEREALEQTLAGKVQPPAPLPVPEVPLYAQPVDADNDFLLTPTDECPQVAGPIENNGCPDTDRDEDGVVDRLDKCPANAESVPEREGCPLARLEGRQLVLSQPIKFATGQEYLLHESTPVLEEAARVLIENPEVRRVEVVAYSADMSKRRLEVARRRAEKVRRHLLLSGVTIERVCSAVRVDPEVLDGPRPAVELVVLEGSRRCMQELSEEPLPLGWPEVASSDEEVLKPFLEASTPEQFIELQYRLDMAEVVERLSPWAAVRLGAQGPLVGGVEVLNRRRVEFIITVTRRFGPDIAQVFTLYLVNHAFTEEVRELLRLLAAEKRLGETVGGMEEVRKALAERGVALEEYADRPEQVRDVGRGLVGLAEAASESTEVSRGIRGATYYQWKGQLPPAYVQVLTEVERQQLREAYATGRYALGVFDHATLGMPVGMYHLVEGTGRGLVSLRAGKWERATQELAPAVLLVALYAKNNAPGAVARARAALSRRLENGGKLPRLSVEKLQADLGEVADRLFNQLGGEGMVEVARYMRDSREATLLVYETGEAGAVALYNTEGNAGRARAWLMEGNTGGKGAPRARAGMRKPQGGLAALVDESVGHTREVVEAKLLTAELEASGGRLPGDIALLEKTRPVLDSPPPGAQGHPLWSEYVAYWENRLAELKQGKAVKPPLKWEGYESMRGLFARGLAFERTMVQLLQADARLPRAQRLFLQDFIQPQIMTHVGVSKPKNKGVRYADVLVVEEAPPTGQPPRVETFSFKSRNFLAAAPEELTSQMKIDARNAVNYYGEELYIRRFPHELHGVLVRIQRVRLIYEGTFKPKNPQILREALDAVKSEVKGVEVFFQ